MAEGEQVVPRKENENRNQGNAEKGMTAEIEEGGPFVAAVQSTRMPMVISDPQLPGNPIVFANDSFLALTGYEREEVLGRSYHFMMAAETDPDARAQIESAFDDAFNATYPEVLYHRKDGSTFWAIIFIGPVFDENKAVVQHFASFVDVTRRKQDEERLRLMLDELDHRVKNTLATVQAIATQSLSGSAVDKQVRDVFEGRVLALSKGHKLLARESWEGASLRELIEQIVKPFGTGQGGTARFSIEGEDFFLGPKGAVALAMMFHELASNAAKFGALSNDAGRVEINWRTEPGPRGSRSRLRWQERFGPPVSPPGHKGFGSRLIEHMLAQELDGEVSLSYEPGGAICEVVMPAPAARGAP